MSDFTPTAEQQLIIDAAVNETYNMAVIARAGAAKTSTLVMIAEALAEAQPSLEILCLAFNKAIATEMTARLPSNCTAKTLHGLGYGAWQRFIGKRCQLVNGKSYKILKGLIDKIEDREERDEAYSFLSETLDIISAGKNVGWLPERYKGHWKPIVRSDDDFFLDLPMEPTALQCELARQVSIESFKQALEGYIDFDDMIFCPAICGVSWPTKPLTLVDESQDLSPINHHILKKLVKRNRLIAVGDPLQAIYGFRGALADSMEQLQQKFDTKPFYLTISFRCGRSIVENAHWLAPDMKAPEWAIDGEVHRLTSWDASMISDGDMIICRNNAPLFSLALKLLEADRLPTIAGKDIAGPLIKLMKKLGKPQLVSMAAIEAVNEWEAKELKRARNGAGGSIKDRAEIIRIMLRRTKTLGDAQAYLEHLLQRDGRIHLMTGHKSKGLEGDNVWFLDQHLCVIKQDQDANIKYVIETRAKRKLSYVTSDTFMENVDAA